MTVKCLVETREERGENRVAGVETRNPSHGDATVQVQRMMKG